MLSDSAPNELSAAETSLIRADRDEFGGLDQFSCDSNEALKLNFCSLNNTFQAKPIYTHHLFDREAIYGYKNLKLDLFFSKSTLSAYFEYNCDEEIELETLKVKDFAEHITESIGLTVVKSKSDFKKIVEQDLNFKPPGINIGKFKLKSRKFFVTKLRNVTDPQTTLLLANLQALNHFYIEHASNVELHEEGWDFYIVFEKTNEDSFATAGYMTAYNFFKYPQMTRKRIAQFLILPEYQGKGIGPKLLEAFYDDCLKDENVYDITVEDANPDFQRMRDKLDFIRLINLAEKPHVECWDVFKNEVHSAFKLSHPQLLRMYQFYVCFHSSRASDSGEMLKNQIWTLNNQPLINQLHKVKLISSKNPDLYADCKNNLTTAALIHKDGMEIIEKFVKEILQQKDAIKA